METQITIKKPKIDTNEYKYLVLENKMRVILVHDATADKSAACMDVDVGQLWDPPNRCGLAHFCEHMLFLGSKKYPKEDELKNYLQNNSGDTNAWTSNTDTNYYFSVSNAGFEGALDRFASVFQEPLFDPSSCDREVKAVDSENARYLNMDSWRFWHLMKLTSLPGSPYCKFGVGDLEHLQKESGLRDDLLKFYKDYYSSNLMVLCLLSKHSMDVMEDWVRKYFTPIPNHD